MKNRRQRAIERNTKHLPTNYFENWCQFVEENCFKCAFGTSINKEFGFDKHINKYPHKCLIFNHNPKDIIKMYICLKIQKCGFFQQNKMDNNIIIENKEGFELIL